MYTASTRGRAAAGGSQRHKVKALAGAATPAGAVTENTPHEPVTADYSISADRPQAKGVNSVGPIEIIYNGYIEEREGIDTAETNEAADNLMGMIESLLPNSDRMQDILYISPLHIHRFMKLRGGRDRCQHQNQGKHILWYGVHLYVIKN